jgi:hypothetical protein
MIEFDQFKSEAGTNTFALSPQKWIDSTNAIGLISKSGRGGGTFAHKDSVHLYCKTKQIYFTVPTAKPIADLYRRVTLMPSTRLTESSGIFHRCFFEDHQVSQPYVL